MWIRNGYVTFRAINRVIFHSYTNIIWSILKDEINSTRGYSSKVCWCGISCIDYTLIS